MSSYYVVPNMTTLPIYYKFFPEHKRRPRYKDGCLAKSKLEVFPPPESLASTDKLGSSHDYMMMMMMSTIKTFQLIICSAIPPPYTALLPPNPPHPSPPLPLPSQTTNFRI